MINTARPLYFDYNATTPIDPEVLRALLPYLEEHFGNPSSCHVYGQRAHRAVEQARSQVASLIGALPDEIIFTGSGTEASNLAIKGSIWPLLTRFTSPGTVRIVTSAIEHPATLRPCQSLTQQGCQLEILPVNRWGVVSLDALRQALKQPAALVSIMHSNNEVGTVQPIREISRMAHEAGALVHTDVAQSLGKLPINVEELGVDLLTIAGHKLYAPKGVGALYVRQGTNLEPLIQGAGHERGMRAGTENVPYIVALGKAAELAQFSLPQATERLSQLRDRLWQLLVQELGEKITLNGHPTERLPNTLNVSVAGWLGSELLAACPEIAASTGSACHEGQVSISPVLTAMGIAPDIARGAVRLSVGRFTTEKEVEQAAAIVSAVNSKS